MGRNLIATLMAVLLMQMAGFAQVVDIEADKAVLDAPFGVQDEVNFLAPPKVFRPQTWFHFIGDNVSREGMDADLEAIAAAGISGVQWFHGAFGGRWPGVEHPIVPLSAEWDDMVGYLARKARSLDLRLTIQTCPGWAMAGGPWVEPKDAMRDLVFARMSVDPGVAGLTINLRLPKGSPSEEEWRDYQDICLLAFPTPEGDAAEPLEPGDVRSAEADWAALLQGGAGVRAKAGGSHTVSFTVPEGSVVRTVELPSINSMNHNFNYTPGVTIRMDAVGEDGRRTKVLDVQLPMASWQDNAPVVLAVDEAPGAARMEFTVSHQHDLSLEYVRLYSGARKNEWPAEAGRTLRAHEPFAEHPRQSDAAYVKSDEVIDITSYLRNGILNWVVPESPNGWTLIRFGHVNSGRKNSPAPAEATGWECDKLDTRGADVQFTNYVGRLQRGPAAGLAGGMLMDSWECNNQTWTWNMEEEFKARAGYDLRKWMPAFAGMVMDSPETTSRLLDDWRRAVSGMYSEYFFKRMTDLAHDAGMKVQYETAGGDVVAMDILEYFKWADVPMCEIWHPISEGYVGDLNFKPIKPTASAAHIYGKRRVAAESFTSFDLNWDEHWEMLKEVANLNMTEGVTHNVFHTYTHNPQVGFLPPGTSFGNKIGTPFLRGQTWWKYMNEFTTYLARNTYMLERGLPVVDVLWYLGDEVPHKPDQRAPFPAGYKYDYCNPDVLLNSLRVKDGKIYTAEGQAYSLFWIPECARMLPETLEKIEKLLDEGALVVLGNPPAGLATLGGGPAAQERLDRLAASVWAKGRRTTLAAALRYAGLRPRLVAEGGEVLWTQREVPGATWFYVTAPVGGEFHGKIRFLIDDDASANRSADARAELWDAVTGEAWSIPAAKDGPYRVIDLDLLRAQNCYIVFRKDNAKSSATAKSGAIRKGGGIQSMKQTRPTEPQPLPVEPQRTLAVGGWTLTFPTGWGAPKKPLQLTELLPWKDLDINEEGKAFSGTATYRAVIELTSDQLSPQVLLDLGDVDMIADVRINGQPAGIRWAHPYKLLIGKYLKAGKNTIEVDVTGTWFNRLAYDASLPEADRKTWTISGPAAGSPLRPSGLLGPVLLRY